MADEPIYRDAAVLAGDRTEDAWEAISESYAFAVSFLVAVLQKTGKVRLPEDWADLAEGFVIIADPLRDGTVRVQAVRRGEVRSDSQEGAARLREKWERLYERRDSR